ncbi:uncharacterized protein OCT59_029367 [Rhizophagus irregularis]|uniref:uncharacterized protein n=1 Tax=Rhizophagus irregularis TaxID=588596 RepID=UPI0033280BC6|nr:hypothetical protein OCT59_029367 [Rhizophagus irregularis]
MSTHFFQKLSQNYIEILKDDEYYDITIEVGEDPDVKIFRAHMIILCYRSPFLRRTLASNKIRNDGNLNHIKLPNISPEIFQVILKYIYGGIFSLDEQDTINISKILTAADQLHLQELVDYLQKSNELCSKIININIVSLTSAWIDNTSINNKFSHIRDFYLPYKFKLLLRGSRDGFTPKSFHSLCNNKPHTITFIKVKGSEEIIGGYNPLIWKNSCEGEWGKTKDSFIFSFKNKNNVKDTILSRIKDLDRALFYCDEFGPAFDTDLLVYVNDDDCLNEYNSSGCKQRSYEKKVRDLVKFSIDDYEVFQIMKKES